MAAALADSINSLTQYLPVELLEGILKYLSPSDLYSFMHSCKSHQVFVFSLLNIFSHYYRQNLPDSFSKNVWNLYLNLKYNYPVGQIQKFKELKFTRVLSAFNYASSNKYELLYNKCMQNTDGRAIIEPSDSPISEIKLRYGLMYTFFNSNIYISFNCNIDYQILRLINSLNTMQFLFFMTVYKNFPDIILPIKLTSYQLINVFRNVNLVHANKFLQMLQHISYLGGRTDNVIIIMNDLGDAGYYKYLMSLFFGFTEEDAYYYARQSSFTRTKEHFITFKALVPIIGYKFAKHFIIDIMYNLDQCPHFLSVVSRYYTLGYVCLRKCEKLLENPSEENMGKLKAKRRRLE